MDLKSILSVNIDIKVKLLSNINHFYDFIFPLLLVN